MRTSFILLILLSGLSGSPGEVEIQPITLTDYEDIWRGASSPVLINFWATWCGPCVKEIPDLQQFADAHKLDIRFVSLDEQNNLEQAKKVLAARGAHGKHYLLNVQDEDLNEVLPGWHGGVPLTIFYQETKSTLVIERAITEADLNQIHNYLEK